MNMMFASDRQREMHQLKQRRMKHILSYNLQQIQRKRKMKEEQSEYVKSNSRHMEDQALTSLMTENRKKEYRTAEQRNMLKENYEKQMKEREERKKMEKAMDRQYFQRQQQYMDYEESRRMMELSRIYNRATYEATPYDYYSRKRIQTEPNEPERMTQHPLVRTPQTNPREPRSLDVKGNFANEEGQPGWKQSPSGIKDSLDNLNAEHIRYPRQESRQNEGMR